jgi:hypothetical protein
LQGLAALCVCLIDGGVVNAHGDKCRLNSKTPS